MQVSTEGYPGWDGQNYSGYEYNHGTGEWVLSPVSDATGQAVRRLWRAHRVVSDVHTVLLVTCTPCYSDVKADTLFPRCACVRVNACGCCM